MAALTMLCCAGQAAAISAGSHATGQINTVPGGNLVDGENFMLDDGAGSLVVFEFDSNGSVSSGNVPVQFTVSKTPDQVKDAIIAAVNGVANFQITASSKGYGLVKLTNDNLGASGNTAIVNNVTNPGFTTEGMTGGSVAPVLASIGDKSVGEGSQLQFSVSATDSDGGGHVYWASNLPPGASFDSDTRTFTWTPGYEQADTYPNVQFSVSDGTWTDSESITITVDDVNRAPVLAAIGRRSVNEGTKLQFQLAATDPDGDELTYSATNLPTGASFDPATRTFSWTPGFDRAGNYPDVHFAVSDGFLTDSEDISISVNNVLRATTTSLSVKKTRSKLKASGLVEPSQAGHEMDVAIYRKRHGRFRLLTTEHPTLGSDSSYHAGFQRPSSGQCRIDASFPGDSEAKPSSTSLAFRC
jgi:hypothetical protein